MILRRLKIDGFGALSGVWMFEPGALHVMAFELDAKLAAGGTAEMTLTFADGDKLSAPLKIESRTGDSTPVEIPPHY